MLESDCSWYTVAMDLDRMYKEFIRACFGDFLRFASLPLYELVDLDTLEFQDKELFTDISVGETSEADLVVKAKVKGEDSFFLVHIENQSTSRPGFAERMFRYFAKIYGKYHLPVYPIAVLSWDEPKRAEPDEFRVELADLRVMEFHYRAIQLNRMDWRNYLQSDNAAASALMTRMNVERKDRPRVKLEALKNIGLLGLNPAVSRVAGWFVDSTLPLDQAEQDEFDARLDAEDRAGKDVLMDMTTSWERRGREEGREVLADTVLVFLRRQVGALDPGKERQVLDLSLERLGELSKALLEFHTQDDFVSWLSHHAG